MDNKEKIYIFFIAINDVIKLTCAVIKSRGELDDSDSEKLLDELLEKGKESYYKQTDLTDSQLYIERILEKLDNNNLELVYSLWFAFNLALNKYWITIMNAYNFEYECETRLAIAHIKYQALSNSESSVTSSWQKFKSEVETKLGFFDD